MEIVLSALVLFGVVMFHAGPERSRVAALSAALGQAVMLHEAAARSGEHDHRSEDPASDADLEVELDLVYMELDSGFLERTCVCNPEQVFDMRLMKAYAQFLRVLGLPDDRVVDSLVARAGERGGQVRRFLDFAGVDGIGHFICVDYLRAALARGMQEHELREYINRVESSRSPASGPRRASTGG